MIAISTIWNSLKYSSATKVVEEIQMMGFEDLELSFNLSLPMIKEILNLKKTHQLNIVSLHNFCPTPDELQRTRALPDCYSLSSLDIEERKKAIFYTKRTIELAAKLQAKAVVLHLGFVDIPVSTRKLIHLFYKGKRDTALYKKALAQILKERNMYKNLYLEAVFRSIEELLKFAISNNVMLGIENRYYIREIPNFEEINLILSQFCNTNIYYWHDIGHAQVMENLGITKQRTFLSSFRERMIGIHIHDIVGMDDHRAPLTGEFDFNILKKELGEFPIIKVLEIHPPARISEILKAKQYLEKILN